MSELKEITIVENETPSFPNQNVNENKVNVNEIIYTSPKTVIISPTNKVQKDYWFKRILKLNNFSLITIAFSCFFFLMIYVSNLLVSNGSDGTNMFVPVLLGFLTAFHFQYVYALRKERNYENKEWNVDKIIWNSFVLLVLTFATTVTSFFFMFKSRGFTLFGDFINKLNPGEMSCFIIIIICYLVLFLMFSWHIIIHRTKVLSL